MNIRLITGLIIFQCCTPATKDSDNAATGQKDTVFLQDSHNGEDRGIASVSLPFGCNMLVNHEFPLKWDTGDLYNMNDIRPHEKEFDSLIRCFNSLHLKKAVSPPPVSEVQLFFADGSEAKEFKDSSAYSIDSCRYKLSDIGGYKCYYAFQNVAANAEEESSRLLLESGNILLCDTETKRAIVINVYSTIAGEVSERRKFFYVDTDQSIKVFNYSIDEEYTRLLSAFIIRPGRSKITVEKIN